MRVIEPETRVNFGFAGVFNILSGGSTGTKVNITSDATILTGTPRGGASSRCTSPIRPGEILLATTGCRH